MEKHMETEIAAINQQSFKDKIKSYTKHPGSFVLLLLVLVAAVLTVGVLVFLVGYILIRGIPYLKPSLFAWTYNSDNVSMLPAMINTLFMTVLALVLSVPFGVGAAIYLVEYAKKGKQVSRDHPCDGGDTFRYSFYYLWTLWYVVFRDSIKMGLLNDGRCSDACNHGTPGHHENDGGSTSLRTGFIP